MARREEVFPIDTMGGRIQRLRDSKEYSRAYFHSLLFPTVDLNDNSRQKTVHNWESGKTYPDYETLRKICEVLNCDANYLLSMQDAPLKETSDISDITGLCLKASDSLRRLKQLRNGYTSAEKQFIEDLLCSDRLYWLATRYREYKEIHNCREYSEFVEADDWIQLPSSGRGFLAIEADTEKEIALFRLQKAIIAFAEENKKEQ